MNDKFILKRKRREYSQSNKHPKISVDLEVYRKLERWAGETGMTLSEVTKRAVNFCEERLTFIDE